MSRTSRALVAIIIAAVVFSCCIWSGWEGGLGTYGPWGLHSSDIYPQDWFQEHYQLWSATLDFLSLIGKLACFGAPAWATVSGVVAFSILGLIEKTRRSVPSRQSPKAGETEVVSRRIESTRLLTSLTALVGLSSLVWGIMGIAQILAGSLNPGQSAEFAGVVKLPGIWIIAIGAANLVGAIWQAIQLRRVHRGVHKGCAALRNISRESTIFLALQAIGHVGTGNPVAGCILVPLTAIEGIAWYLSQRLLSTVERNGEQ